MGRGFIPLLLSLLQSKWGLIEKGRELTLPLLPKQSHKPLSGTLMSTTLMSLTSLTLLAAYPALAVRPVADSAQYFLFAGRFVFRS